MSLFLFLSPPFFLPLERSKCVNFTQGRETTSVWFCDAEQHKLKKIRSLNWKRADHKCHCLVIAVVLYACNVWACENYSIYNKITRPVN